MPTKDLHLEDDERKKLNSFISQQIGPGKFNFSYLAIKSLEQCIAALPDNGVIFLSDFGYTEIYKDSDSFTKFGNIIACPISFPVLMHASQEAGGHTTLAKHQEGYPHELLICKTPDPELEKLFNNTFREYGGEVIRSFVEEYTSVLTSEIPEKYKDIKLIFNNLPTTYKSDHDLLTNLANALVQHDLNEEAVRFSDLALTDYSHVGGAAFRIKGRALVKLGKLEAAEENFNKALEISEMMIKLTYIYLVCTGNSKNSKSSFKSCGVM